MKSEIDVLKKGRIIMVKKSIFKQMLIPMVAIVSGLAVVLLVIMSVFFSSFYEGEIYSRNQDKVKLLAGWSFCTYRIPVACRQGVHRGNWLTVPTAGGLSRPWKKRNPLYPSPTILLIPECHVHLYYSPCIRGII